MRGAPFALLSCLVVLMVVALLHAKGIAMTKETRALSCPVEGAVAHQHDASCYDDSGVLVCTLPEAKEHQHGADCYDDEGALVCGLEELTETHVHGPGCFVTVQVDDPVEEGAEAQEGDAAQESASPEGAATQEGDASAPQTAAKASQAAPRKAAGSGDGGTRRETTDLSELLKSLVIKKGDYEVDFETGGDLLFHDGDEFSIKFVFEEKDTIQFKNDATPMYFDLPEGFNLSKDFTFEQDITVNRGGVEYVVKGNTFTYEPAVTDPEHPKNDHGPRIKLVLNAGDPNFAYLTESEDACVDVTVNGSFSFEPGKSIQFGDKSITLVEPHDVGVTKTAVYDQDSKTVLYTVTVAADGQVSEAVTVQDVVAGSALTITGNVSVQSYLPSTEESGLVANTRADISATVSENGKGFSSAIPNMQNGETIVYTYTAEVDFTKLSRGDGETTFDEAGNTVTINGMNPATDYGHNNEGTAQPRIPFTDIKKSVQMDSSVTSEGDNVWRYIHWTVEVNSEAAATLAGAPITDHFSDYNSNLPMYYAGKGLTIERWSQQLDGAGKPVVDAQGNPVLVKVGEDEQASWASVGIANTASASYVPRRAGWTYDVPEDDAPYKYVIHYDTRVDMRKLAGTYDVVNYSEVKGLDADANVVVEPIGNGDHIDIEKSVVSMSNDTITWKIVVKLRETGYDSFTVNDLLPNNWIRNEFYSDTLQSYRVVSGLVDGERLDESGVTVTSGRGSYTTLTLPFQKKNDQGEWVSGLKGTGQKRDLVIEVVTNNNKDWLKLMLDPATETWQQVHNNRAEVWADNMYDLAIASASPMPLKLTKTYSKPSDTHGVEQRQTTDHYADGSKAESAPLYRFHVTLSGVMSDKLTVHDTFDTSLFGLTYLDSFEIAGSDNAWWHQSGDPRVSADKRAIVTTKDGFDVTFPVPRRASDGGFYSYYHLVYYLVPKDAEAMAEILRIAGANPQEGTPYGLALFENTAWVNGAEPKTAEFDYPYKASGKTGARNGNKISYVLELNTAKAKLNGGQTIEAYDTHSSNLSVIYNTVQWETDPAENHDLVTWDMSGSQATFRIPTRPTSRSPTTPTWWWLTARRRTSGTSLTCWDTLTRQATRRLSTREAVRPASTCLTCTSTTTAT